MQSKNWSCKFSLSLFRKDVTRFWPVWVSYFVIWGMILPIPLLNVCMDGSFDAGDLNRLLVRSGEGSAVVMTLLYGGLAAFAVWSFLYRQNSASLYLALPVTRESQFLTHFFSGYSFLLIPNCVIALLTWLCQLSIGLPDPTLVLQWLAIVSLEGLLFYSIGTLAAMLTGNLVAMPVLYGLLNFAVVACEAMIVEFSTSLYYGVNSIDYRLTALSPAAHLLDNEPGLYMTAQFTEMGTIAYAKNLMYYDPKFFCLLGWYTIAALMLIGCGLLLYRRHATESAGDVVSVPWLRPVAKYTFSIGCALCLGWIFEQILFSHDTTAWTILISCALGGVIGYFAALMLLSKSFRVFKPRQILGFVPVLLALCLWVWGVNTDLFGVESYIPEANDIERIELRLDYDIIFTNSRDFDQILALHKATLETGEPDPLDVDARYHVEYRLTDGTRISRWYDVVTDKTALASSNSPASRLAAIFNDPYHLVAHYLPPEGSLLEIGHIYAYHTDIQLANGLDPNIRTEHLSLVADAIEQDLRSGKTGIWPANRDKVTDPWFRLELQCAVPLEDVKTVTWTTPTAVDGGRDGYRYLWFEVPYYDNYADTALWQLLRQLGYLK